MNFTNVAEKRISNNTKLIYQINLITRCEDNIFKAPQEFFRKVQFHELRNLLQPSCVKKEYLKAFHLNISSLHCSELIAS